MSKRDILILECRYYAGEMENPFAQKLDAYEVDKSHLPSPECMQSEYNLPPDEVNYLNNAAIAWKYECFWVEKNVEENMKDVFEANEYYAEELKGFEPNDGTPIGLKALLWNRYEHWSFGTLESFKEWYRKYYQSRPTNRQRRAEERN